MPWTAADADKHKKGLKPAQKAQWAKIANGVLKSCTAQKGSDCEGKAVRIANSKFSVVDINSTWTEADMDDHDEFFGFKDQSKSVTEARKKPGGSNVGTYKKGPFCGPAGGAPKGSYPVDTKKRAKAALAYARNAPNPQGIKNCVYKHWPELKPEAKNKHSEVPKGALRLVDNGTAHCEFADVDGKKTPKLSMVAYSGKVIKNHFYWGHLVIDLSGMKFEGTKFPILENHDTGRKIAFTGKPIVTDGNELHINPETTVFVDTEASAEFQKLSAEGFPYQASIYAKPLVIERVEEGGSVDVNGYKFKGPGVIWRQSVFKESSVCVFGWDTKTSSSAFSKTEMEDVDADMEFLSDEEDTFYNDINSNEPEEGGESMDWDEFKESNPEAVQKFADQVKKDVTEELTKKFNDEKQKLDTENASLSEKVANLEKNDALRSQRELAMEAGAIVNACLSESDVTESLHVKVKNMINYTKFVKDGVLDHDKFTEAVKTEIKDWEDKGATAKVMGTGFSKKNETGNNAPEQTRFAEENKNLLSDLLGRVGQKLEEKK